MEIGSFIELQFPKGKEYYSQKTDIARLNSGRAAIWHAFRVLDCKAIWLPYYQCDTVREFLRRKNIVIKYYHIDNTFSPTDLLPGSDEAVLLVNYFGVFSSERMASLVGCYKNVIIDNSQAFFSKPLENCLNVYSCRKFIGVSDGAYVIGRGAERFVESYAQGYSSDTSIFLLQRIEYGCEGKSYQSRMINEHRIGSEDCLQMSGLTHAILDGTDYNYIKEKRRDNYAIACTLFNDINCLDVNRYHDNETVPMVYPLVVEDDSLIERLQKAKHFQGHWWDYLLKEVSESTFEYWMSRYIVPITIDQRYGKDEINCLSSFIMLDEKKYEKSLDIREK